MVMTKHKPPSVGEILAEEFVEPFGLTRGGLADVLARHPAPVLREAGYGGTANCNIRS
jgi:plasmid maintenance system antidote protein VapI